MIYLAIIGTAGRNDDADKLTDQHFKYMIKTSRDYIKTLDDDVTLVSGGSAWADHVAIRLFKKDKRDLILYLPYKFNNNKYEDDYLNSLHRKFSQKCVIDSLNEIENIFEY